MTTGSLGLRSSGSYGSLHQFQNGSLCLPIPIQTTPPISRKPIKIVKEKEKLLHWIFKFAPRKKIGMLLLCFVSLAVFMWVLIVGKGEDARETIPRINIVPVPLSDYNNINTNINSSSQIMDMKTTSNATPPVFFTGYKLPPENPCEHFALPPPPADKKRTGPRPCPVCYLPLDDAVGLMPKAPSFSPVIKDLKYIHDENLNKSEFGGSEFGGYPSLGQRNDSYDIRESMNVHCGFVRGIKPGRLTGFDINDSDLLEMENCRGVVVASAIFETNSFLRNSSALDGDEKVGIWKIIVVRNLPYSDPRRNGKIPKLLLHRLFPNARYSMWIDAKLELVVDPFQILERFLWRKNASFAISRHYKRFDVFSEAEANKAAGKYDNASIDFQVDFYKNEGLTSYSEAKLPVTSDVPEGCVIIKEHIPITNLFTCLWFNEVDRFTSRDQISFSTGYHRDLLDHWTPGDNTHVNPPPPPVILNDDDNLNKTTSDGILADIITSSGTITKSPTKHGKDRKSRGHRKTTNLNFA
ncbi:hypothetical protein PHJA_001777500 [Phtheirospermum japonicum]|uniref:TOD1/MUCI70 glycosyltransferase-like domain-containing protein n=1 Tax=Phtheirospermum japonicum TaxID=374723 RepID=A0A830CJ70_9LAMI|nr:hypothetical protein PHJA_001777500 [Phtheirospermum japonicum]